MRPLQAEARIFPRDMKILYTKDPIFLNENKYDAQKRASMGSVPYESIELIADSPR